MKNELMSRLNVELPVLNIRSNHRNDFGDTQNLEGFMNLDSFRSRFAAIVFCLAFLLVSPAVVVGQDVQPRVAAGTGVSAQTQQNLGLVTVNGGCSGTLLNQYWVLTARHCVTVDAKVASAFHQANQLRVTATWSAKTGVVSRIHDFRINSAAGSALDRDIVLLYLGSTNLGPVANQKLFVVTRDGKLSGRLKETDTVTQYGRGFSTFAKDLATPSGGDGPYRSAVFKPSSISETHYNLQMANKQSGHGGDSGGPSIVTIYDQPNGGIAGVQSTCEAAGYLTGAPSKTWDWATGINYCTYVSTEPFLSEIAAAIKEAPLKTPYITAGQVIIPSPYHPFASVYLGWDGGPDHPNVEVFVSVNKGPDVPAYAIDQSPGSPVFKQPKISAFEMKLPRRSGTYRYSLKAGGVTLAITDFLYVQ